ncbi:MAG: molybdopterin-dependent oxidoreductase [Desulfobacterales bacterium]
MAKQTVYSVCGMCTVRCPIVAEVEDGRVVFVRGNAHAPGMSPGVCARGAAGIALVEDSERPQSPLIRKGNRGEGKWQKVSWDEAFAYVGEKLKKIFDEHGARSLLITDRGGPFRDMHRAFLRGVGSPNYCNHDGSCARNVQHAALSVFGFGRKDVTYDLKNARHVVLQTRNLFEAINVREVSEMTAALENGCRLSVIDIRSTVSAAKAHNFFQVRPGTDYAFNLAVIHELIDKKLYDADYVSKYVSDFDRLEDFVRLCTPEWAERETGVSASRIRSFVKELAEAAPAVLWHPGWMTARYKNSFYVSRTIYIINSLLGSVGAKGGLPITNKPADYERKGLRQFMDIYPKPEEKRADGAGWKYPHFESGPGVTHLAFKAMETQEPYPLKAYIAYRHDPLMGFADPDHLQKVFSNLDLLVSVTFSWSDTAWYSDVILPMSPYLERESILASKSDLIPYLFIRKRAVEPRYDTKADWQIVSGLSKVMGLKELVFDSVEDIWNYQLQGTGVKIEDFDEKGVVLLGEKPLYRDQDSLKFKTGSGKIEIVSEKLEKQGVPSLLPYESPARPPKGTYRLTFGRCGLHTQGHTVNNPLLFEQMPENVLWINSASAEKQGIADGDMVEVSNADGYSESIRAKVTDQIHPDAVFTVHGFGHRLPVESRAKGRGLADNRFMPRGNEIWDKAGGAVAMQEHFVSVRKISEKRVS